MLLKFKFHDECNVISGKIWFRFFVELVLESQLVIDFCEVEGVRPLFILKIKFTVNVSVKFCVMVMILQGKSEV